MNTEITENNANEPAGWIFYDGECRLCRESVHRLEHVLARRRFQFRTLQFPEAPERLGLSGPALLREMRLLLADGRELGGSDAVVEIARRIWWAWPLWLLSQVPGMMRLLDAVYLVFAANRDCVGGACGVDPNARDRGKIADWKIALILLLIASALGIMKGGLE